MTLGGPCIHSHPKKVTCNLLIRHFLAWLIVFAGGIHIADTRTFSGRKMTSATTQRAAKIGLKLNIVPLASEWFVVEHKDGTA